MEYLPVWIGKIRRAQAKIQPWHHASVPHLRAPFVSPLILVFLSPLDIKAYIKKKIDECSWGNIVVLGLELDLTLQGIGEDLKGWTNLDKP